MSQWLNLARAAQLIGVPRSVIQKKIRDGEIQTYDGMVATEELLRVYPDLNLEETGAFERVTQIKERSFGRRIRERMLPTQEILAQRLVAQSEELADVRRHLSRYHELVEALRAQIECCVQESPSEQVLRLGNLLDEGLRSVLGSQEKPDALEIMDDVLRVISAHVVARPSGREFFVEGSESILDAALRAGLAPSYGCGNGNCGLCKARVVSGEVRQIQPYDYALSAAEKAQNYTLLCSHTAVSDLTVEMLEAESPADIPEQEIAAKVRSATPLDGETVLLRVQTPRTSRLRFFAGQSVTLGVAGGTADFSGEYPVASCPCDDRNLLFHIPNDGEDEFSQRVFAGAVAAGDNINVRGPWGTFVLRKGPMRPLLFLACDTGFAQAKSLIEYAVSIDAAERISLHWAATRPGGHYLANQCRAWAEGLDEFRFDLVEAADPAAAAACAVESVRSRLSDLPAWEVYVCGPPAFADAVRDGLEAAGLPADRIVSG